ncbi:MAG TPA: START domain-containing protein [Cyclobacteriaceae bacterium]|nr:START domain-containing protein [Cyclobacteriaceae bacterium]
MIKMSIVLLLLALSFIAKAQDGCTIRINKDSVRIRQCKLTDSRFKSIEATFQVNSKLSQLAAMILDVEGHVTWEYKTINARTLKKVSEREVIFYSEVAAPMLTSNRDFIIQLRINQDAVTKVMTIDAVSLPNYLPAKENIVRIPYSKAHWIIKPVGKSMLDVVYTLEVDIGGAVPPWLANLVSAQGPYETFKAMRAQIGNYRNKGVSFIKD